MARLPERFLLQLDRGYGLQQRLYHMKREVQDPNSDLTFLQEKPFVGLNKDLMAFVRPVLAFQMSGKQIEDVSKLMSKVKKHLQVHFDTLMDVAQFCEDVMDTFNEVEKQGIVFDANRCPGKRLIFKI